MAYSDVCHAKNGELNSVLARREDPGPMDTRSERGRERSGVRTSSSHGRTGVLRGQYGRALGATSSTPEQTAVLHVDDHLLMYIRVAHHATELLERNLPVLVAVREQNGLVHDLLQLSVLQVVADHHLEDLQPWKQLSVAPERYLR